LGSPEVLQGEIKKMKSGSRRGGGKNSIVKGILGIDQLNLGVKSRLKEGGTKKRKSGEKRAGKLWSTGKVVKKPRGGGVRKVGIREIRCRGKKRGLRLGKREGDMGGRSQKRPAGGKLTRRLLIFWKERGVICVGWVFHVLPRGGGVLG